MVKNHTTKCEVYSMWQGCDSWPEPTGPHKQNAQVCIRSGCGSDFRLWVRFSFNIWQYQWGQVTGACVQSARMCTHSKRRKKPRGPNHHACLTLPPCGPSQTEEENAKIDQNVHIKNYVCKNSLKACLQQERQLLREYINCITTHTKDDNWSNYS